jgi:hypothetical protein
MATTDDDGNGNFEGPEFGNVYYNWFFAMLLVASVLPAMCSFIVIRVCSILLGMTKHKGHLRLICAMSISQFMYDCWFFFAIAFTGSKGLFLAGTVLNRFFGCCATLFTNYIAFVAFYSVRMKVFVNVNTYYVYLIAASFVPGIIDAVLYLSKHQSKANDFYFWFRISSIGINVILCTLILQAIYEIRSNKNTATSHDRILQKLAIRMMYYPIVQIISRSAIAYYEYSNNFIFSPFACDSNSEYAGLLAAILLSPCASYGYLAIFFMMQPKAFRIFRTKTLIGWFSVWDYVCFFLPSQVKLLREANKFAHNNSAATPTGLTQVSVRGVSEHTNVNSEFTAPDVFPETSLFQRDNDEDEDDFLIDMYSEQSLKALGHSISHSLSNPLANNDSLTQM